MCMEKYLCKVLSCNGRMLLASFKTKSRIITKIFTINEYYSNVFFWCCYLMISII